MTAMTKRGITQADIKRMSESELAVLASKAPSGLTAVFHADGTFSFLSDLTIEEMSPSERAKITIIGRAH